MQLLLSLFFANTRVYARWHQRSDFLKKIFTHQITIKKMYVYLQCRKIKQCKRIRLFYPLCIQEAKMKQTANVFQKNYFETYALQNFFFHFLIRKFSSSTRPARVAKYDIPVYGRERWETESVCSANRKDRGIQEFKLLYKNYYNIPQGQMRWFSKTSTGLRITSLLQEEEKNVNLLTKNKAQSFRQILVLTHIERFLK